MSSSASSISNSSSILSKTLAASSSYLSAEKKLKNNKKGYIIYTVIAKENISGSYRPPLSRNFNVNNMVLFVHQREVKQNILKKYMEIKN